MKKSNETPALKNKPENEVFAEKAEYAPPFDLAKASKKISRADPVMARVIKATGPCRLKLQPLQNCFDGLVESIVYQQLTAKAAASILKRIKGLYGNKFPGPGQIIKTSEEDLRAAGLSRAKAMAIRDLAEKTRNGTLPLIGDLATMQDEDIVDVFSSVRGIGEWTVQMFLIFRLGRPDVMPSQDYGVRKGFARAFDLAELPSPASITARSESWRPYRTVASWYLWNLPEEF